MPPTDPAQAYADSQQEITGPDFRRERAAAFRAGVAAERERLKGQAYVRPVFPIEWDKVIGKWPGDETDEQIQAALRDDATPAG